MRPPFILVPSTLPAEVGRHRLRDARRSSSAEVFGHRLRYARLSVVALIRSAAGSKQKTLSMQWGRPGDGHAVGARLIHHSSQLLVISLQLHELEEILRDDILAGGPLETQQESRHGVEIPVRTQTLWCPTHISPDRRQLQGLDG